MIEGPNPGPRPRRGGTWPWVPDDLRQRLVGLWTGLRRLAVASVGARPQADPFLWRLRLVERGFWVVLVLLGAYVLLDLTWLGRRPAPSLAQYARAGGGSAGGGTAPEASVPPVIQQLRPAAEYRETLVSRNPFQLAISGAGAATSRAAATSRSRLEELTGTLAVVGINRGRTPEALVEDTVAGRTHFLKVGDQLNDMTVTAIDGRGVTFRYEGEEITLE